MSFNSFGFVFAFLPICLIIYGILQKRENTRGWSCYFLIAASLVFYGIAYKWGLITLFISLAVNFFFARALIRKPKDRLLLWLGIAFNVLFLSFFKYGYLFFDLSGKGISAPGVSFYSFCQIALLFEIYRGEVKEISLGEYGFLMTFFPKMAEGPIVRPKELLPQLEKRKSLSWERGYRCLMLFSLGLFKKVIIAECLKSAVDFAFANPSLIHTSEALVVILSYTLQLYFDFSGYTDMALSIALLFGFKLPQNFESPYKAVDIEDFWKRWHISLTTFFTYYLYVPLGGSRKGRTRTYINILIIFFVSGLWHGAGWQFIIWGMMHGLLYVIVRFLKDRKLLSENAYKNSIFRLISTVFTFIYVNIAWVFFRAPSLSAAVRLFKSVQECWFPRFNTSLAKCYNLDELWYVIKVLHLDKSSFGIYILMILILLSLLLLIFLAPNACEYSKKCKIGVVNTVLMLVLLAWSILSFEGVATYIYVNF